MSDALAQPGDRRTNERSLHRCAEIFEGLEAALLAEQQALLDRDPETLIHVAERKRTLLLELQHCAVALAELPSADPAFRDQLEARFERCRQLNQVNGGVVAASRGATEKALALLRGEQFGVPLYDNQGASHATGSSRALAQA